METVIYAVAGLLAGIIVGYLIADARAKARAAANSAETGGQEAKFLEAIGPVKFHLEQMQQVVTRLEKDRNDLGLQAMLCKPGC